MPVASLANGVMANAILLHARQRVVCFSDLFDGG